MNLKDLFVKNFLSSLLGVWSSAVVTRKRKCQSAIQRQPKGLKLPTNDAVGVQLATPKPMMKQYVIIKSSQIIIFHQPRFPWNKGISLTKPPFGVRSCEVAIIWPDQIISICGMILHLKKHRKLYPRSSLSGGFLPAWQVRNLFSILIARVYQETNSDEPSWAIQNENANSIKQHVSIHRFVCRMVSSSLQYRLFTLTTNRPKKHYAKKTISQNCLKHALCSLNLIWFDLFWLCIVQVWLPRQAAWWCARSGASCRCP